VTAPKDFTVLSARPRVLEQRFGVIGLKVQVTASTSLELWWTVDGHRVLLSLLSSRVQGARVECQLGKASPLMTQASPSLECETKGTMLLTLKMVRNTTPYLLIFLKLSLS
jgi:hypothetical protein